MHEILVVEDDPMLQKALCRSLRQAGYAVCAYDQAESMLQELPEKLKLDRLFCILIDVNLGSVSGIDAQKMLRLIDVNLPVVFMSAHQDARTVNEAWRDGACNFLFKPFTPKELLDTLSDVEKAQHATRAATESELSPATTPELQEQVASLTPRQLQVLELLVTGMTHGEIAKRIGISARTVKLHRAAMMQRLGTKNLPDLVRFYETCRPLLAKIAYESNGIDHVYPGRNKS